MSNTYTDLRYHVIIGTRDRQPLIHNAQRDELSRYIQGILRKKRSWALQIDGLADHLHLLLNLHPDFAVADMLRLIKTNSSKWLNERRSHRDRFAWEPGYAAFTVSALQSQMVERFICNQKQIHRKMSSAEEYRRIVEKHGLSHEGDTHAYLAVHFIFSTKLRLPLITPSHKEQAFRVLADLVEEQRGRSLAVGGMSDHVHILAQIPRTVAVADFMEAVKSTANHRLSSRGDSPDFVAWQRGYGAFSVSHSQVPVIVRYIERQEEHHREISFGEELRRLLMEHGLTTENSESEARRGESEPRRGES